MILFDDFFKHYYQVKIDHSLSDGMMICMGNFIGKIVFLQHSVAGFVCGFFVHCVSAEIVGLVSLFTCILCFQHCNIKNEFMSLICSIINIFDFECEDLILEIAEIDFCALVLNVQEKINFDMLIFNIEVIYLIFFTFEGLVGFRTLS